MLSQLERIEASSMPEPNSGCWLWLAVLSKRGYGRLTIGSRGKDRREVLAHRLSYEVFVGDPSGYVVCHRCDTPACVNPDHLFAGTQSDNMVDMKTKGRGRKPLGKSHCVHGHKLPESHPPRTGCPVCKLIWNREHYQKKRLSK